VLAAVAGSRSGLSNAEVSESLGLDRSTSHRLLATLERRGYVARIDARRFTAGAELRRLAWGAGPDLELVLQPILHALVELSGESASFSIQSVDHFYCVMHRSSPHELSYSPATGHSYPLNSGAAGFAIWAFLADADRDRLLASGRFPSFTATTPSTRKALAEELERTRQRGYGVSAGVRTPGGCSIACPAIGQQGTVMGALALSAAELRVPLDELVRYEPELSRATARLLSEMKWSDGSPEAPR
jgi:DNA-binding IclR family transcriptional regulator